MKKKLKIIFEIKIIFISTLAILLTTLCLYFTNNFYFKDKTIQDAKNNLDAIRNAKIQALEQYINTIIKSVEELANNETFKREINFIDEYVNNNDLNMRIMVDDDYIPVDQIKKDLKRNKNSFFLNFYTKKNLLKETIEIEKEDNMSLLFKHFDMFGSKFGDKNPYKSLNKELAQNEFYVNFLKQENDTHALVGKFIKRFLNQIFADDLYVVSNNTIIYSHNTPFLKYTNILLNKENKKNWLNKSFPVVNDIFMQKIKKLSPTNENEDYGITLTDVYIDPLNQNRPCFYITMTYIVNGEPLVLVFKYDLKNLQSILDGEKNWIANGYSSTGMHYLVNAKNNKLITDIRENISDPASYLKKIENLSKDIKLELKSKVEEEGIDANNSKFYKINTRLEKNEELITALKLNQLPVNGMTLSNKAIKYAINNYSSTIQSPNYFNQESIISFGKLNIPDVNWIFMVERQTSDILSILDVVTKNIIYISLFVLILFAVLNGIFAGILIKPLANIVNTIQLITQGDYSRRMITKRNDEFGTLQRAINQMTNSIERNEFYKNVFEKEMRAAKDAALDASKTKSSFIANMSHELRTPLNAIIGYTEILSEDAEDRGDDAAVDDLNKINDAGKHLLQLINSILDLSKIESGKMELFIEQFKLKDFLKSIKSIASPLTDKKGNNLEFDVEDEEIIISSDETKVRQCLFNYISNAAKFTEKGTITLKVTSKQIDGNNLLKFDVIDTGIGIPPEGVEKLFKEFTQVDASTTKKYGGTGLGLSITRKFAEMMGGTTYVSSIEGQGSTFSIEILQTLTEESQKNDQSENLKQKNEKETQQKKILVVDEDEQILNEYTSILTKENYDVYISRDSKSAITIAKQIRPNLLVINSKIKSDFENESILQDFTNLEDFWLTPKIVFNEFIKSDSGYNPVENTAFLGKPIDQQDLIKVVKKYIGENSNILVIDDESSMRSYIKKLLEKSLNIKVNEAVNGLDGFNQLVQRKVNPDLVILDLMMPKMDGFTFLKKIREKTEFYNLPIVVFTSKDLSASEQEILLQSSLKILKKGDLSNEQLLEIIKDLI